jgi:integrase
MKGIFQERPQLQRKLTWDVSVVLQYFKSKYPARKLTIMQLTVKLIILLALVMGQRQQGLHLIDVRNLDLKYDKVMIRYGDIMKSTKINFHQEEIVVKAYPKDKRLCPVWYLKHYLERTNTYRESRKLFLITQKPFGPASKETIARWLRMGLSEAGIDMNIFTPHSTRSASTSAMRKANVPLSTILKTAGWSSEKTFAKYYHKKIVTEGVTLDQLA